MRLPSGCRAALVLALTAASAAAQGAPQAAKAAAAPIVQISTPSFAKVVAVAAPSIVSITANRRGWTAAPAPALVPGGGPGGAQAGPDEPGKPRGPGESETTLVPPGPSLGSGVI